MSLRLTNRPANKRLLIVGRASRRDSKSNGFLKTKLHLSRKKYFVNKKKLYQSRLSRMPLKLIEPPTRLLSGEIRYNGFGAALSCVSKNNVNALFFLCVHQRTRKVKSVGNPK